MKIQKYCRVESSPCHNDMYLIGYEDRFYNLVGPVRGSYHILQARIFGIDYANYLRMLRDKYNAVIIGKEHRCPVAYFKNKEDINKIVNELNIRFTEFFERF